VRRSPCGALDLHVLGLPPAFVLSHDQTLKLTWITAGNRHGKQFPNPLGFVVRKTLIEGSSYSTLSGFDPEKSLLGLTQEDAYRTFVDFRDTQNNKTVYFFRSYDLRKDCDITSQDYLSEDKQPPLRIAVCASLLI
jgi:hypothetical protein